MEKVKYMLTNYKVTNSNFVSDFLKENLKKSGKIKKDLVDDLGISWPSAVNWTSGKYKPKYIEDVYRIVEYFGYELIIVKKVSNGQHKY